MTRLHKNDTYSDAFQFVDLKFYFITLIIIIIYKKSEKRGMVRYRGAFRHLLNYYMFILNSIIFILK
jgi:hypothetical protein